jgi:TonB-linked SusC/RagA family outer membrane protein
MLLFIFISAASFAQNIQVSGTVISGEDNEPIIGASVTVKGNTSIGAATDLDGKFTLNVPQSSKTLVISYIGMKTQEVPVKERVDIVLRPDEQMLGEVVVINNGYQKIDRRLFTGSASQLDAATANIEGIADVSKSLQGRVAGVNVQSVSGTFGAAPKLQVRGATSIHGSQSPLWVVDGVILEDMVNVSAADLSSGDANTIISSAVAGLNADDIENFQILKDASATALYGARAMNGVIVITTKRGKTGTVSVNYTGEFSTRITPSYSNYNLMNSQEQMGVYKELESKGWLNYSDVMSRSNSGLYGYMYSLMENKDSNGKFLLENTPYAKAKYLQQSEMINTDWFKELFRQTIVQTHSVSMSSGSERNRNYASLSYMDDPGWSIADKVQRFTGNFNSTTDISKTVTAGFKLNGSFRNQQLPGTTNRSIDAVAGEVSRDFDINPFSYAMNTSRTLDPNKFYRMNYAPFNEKYEVANDYMTIKNSDLLFQIDLGWKPIKELEISALGSYRYAKVTNESKIFDSSNMALAYRAAETSTIAKDNNFLYTDPDRPVDLPVSVMPEGGFYNMQEYDINSYYARAQANFNKTFNEIHLTNFLVGSEVRSLDRTESYSYGYGYQWAQGGIPYTDYRVIKKTLEGGFDYYGYKETWDRAAAAFATASYSYLGKYTATLSGRYDGTNQLGRGAKVAWLPTGTVSGGWRLKEEAFLKENKTITNLGLRATYGLTAKPVPDQANALLILKNDVTFRPTLPEKESEIYIESNQNDDLTWEKMKEFNIGLDFALWNRLSITMDVYNRNGFDILTQVRTSGIGGQFYKWANNATLNTKGIEFSLGGRPLNTKTFSWDTNFTFSYSKGEITDLKQENNLIGLITQDGGNMEGYPIYSLFSFQFDGLSEDGYPKIIDETNESSVAGAYFQSHDTQYLVYEGPLIAPTQGGFSNIFSYKDWKLSAYLTYQFGGVLRLDPMFKSSYSDLDVMPREMKNRWMVPGDEAKTNIPVIADRAQVYNNDDLDAAYMAYNYSTVRVAKSDYIRLKEVFVEYNVPATFSQRLSLNRVQLKLTASNLALLYADKRLNGQDPEFMKSGGVALPNPKQITLTLRVGL